MRLLSDVGNFFAFRRLIIIYRDGTHSNELTKKFFNLSEDLLISNKLRGCARARFRISNYLQVTIWFSNFFFSILKSLVEHHIDLKVS